MSNTLQHLRRYARWVLACMVLTVGCSIASPLLNAQSLQLVCSAVGSVKLVQVSDDGSLPVNGHALDCPLCIPIAPPPPLLALNIEQPQPLAYATHWVVVAHITARLGPPLPPRGPPAFI